MTPAELAALSREGFERLSAGTALARAQYDGLRRNALLALGAARDPRARPVVERLTVDPSPIVREAAVWALARIDGPSRAS
jgi:epoxyqueuosine reductase